MVYLHCAGSDKDAESTLYASFSSSSSSFSSSSSSNIALRPQKPELYTFTIYF